MVSRVEPFPCISSAWRAYEGELLGYLRHRLGDPDAAADVLQDVFVKGLRQGRAFCALQNPRAWLFQVARNAMIDRVRTTHPHEALTQELLEATAASDPERPEPVDALADCLSRTLAELSPADEAILRACDLGGETQRVFAEREGLTLAAVKSRLLRARHRLRQRMVQACQVDFDGKGRVTAHVPRTDFLRLAEAASLPSDGAG